MCPRCGRHHEYLIYVRNLTGVRCDDCNFSGWYAWPTKENGHTERMFTVKEGEVFDPSEFFYEVEED